jgi:hypothetical protein
MKLVMSTTVAAVVLTLLATGLAEADNKDCTNVRKECRASFPFGSGRCFYWDREPVSRYTKVSECIRARGCVPLSQQAVQQQALQAQQKGQ